MSNALGTFLTYFLPSCVFHSVVLMVHVKSGHGMLDVALTAGGAGRQAQHARFKRGPARQPTAVEGRPFGRPLSLPSPPLQ